jgi:hypothetical protein
MNKRKKCTKKKRIVLGEIMPVWVEKDRESTKWKNSYDIKYPNTRTRQKKFLKCSAAKIDYLEWKRKDD